MNTALILIDLQNDYFPGGKMELVGSVAASLRAAEVLALFREQKLPLVHIRHISVRPGAAFFLPGTSGAAFHENVKPLATETVIEKNFPNSFRATRLLDHLKETGIKNLAIAGMMTHMCVDATTRAAFDHGFECTLLHDACATKVLSFRDTTVPAEHVHAAFLSALNGIYAKVVNCEQFIADFR
ncbi:MAG: cysteine hydrolase family protein [Syntrophobacteraceae bacterium]